MESHRGPTRKTRPAYGSFEPEKTPQIPCGGVVDGRRLLLPRKRRKRQRARRRRHRERRSGVNVAPVPQIHDSDLFGYHNRVGSNPLGPEHDQIVAFLLQRLALDLRIERLTSPENRHLLHRQPASPRHPRVIGARPPLRRRRNNPLPLLRSGHRLPVDPAGSSAINIIMTIIIIEIPIAPPTGKTRRWNSDPFNQAVLGP